MIVGYTKQELTSIAVIAVVIALVVFVQGAALPTTLVGGVIGLIAAALGIRLWSSDDDL